jgi:hypothetical protein
MKYYLIGEKEFTTLEEAKAYQSEFGGIIMTRHRTA